MLSDLRNRSGLNSKPAGTGGDVPKSHGYSSSRRVKETKHDFQPRDGSEQDPQVKVGFIIRTRTIDYKIFFMKLITVICIFLSADIKSKK